jgi:hypothetical protein
MKIIEAKSRVAIGYLNSPESSLSRKDLPNIKDIKFGWYCNNNNNNLTNESVLVPVKLGVVHKINEGEIALCSNGLHSSKLLSDALSYVSNPKFIYFVAYWGEVQETVDKSASRYRAYLSIKLSKDLMETFFNRYYTTEDVRSFYNLSSAYDYDLNEFNKYCGKDSHYLSLMQCYSAYNIEAFLSTLRSISKEDWEVTANKFNKFVNDYMWVASLKQDFKDKIKLIKSNIK